MTLHRDPTPCPHGWTPCPDARGFGHACDEGAGHRGDHRCGLCGETCPNPDRAQIAALAEHGPPPRVVTLVRPGLAAVHFAD